MSISLGNCKVAFSMSYKKASLSSPASQKLQKTYVQEERGSCPILSKCGYSKLTLWTQILSSKKISISWFLQMLWHKRKIVCGMYLKVELLGSEIKAKPDKSQIRKYTFKILCCDWIVRKHRKASDQKTSNDHLKRLSFGFIFLWELWSKNLSSNSELISTSEKCRQFLSPC